MKGVSECGREHERCNVFHKMQSEMEALKAVRASFTDIGSEICVKNKEWAVLLWI